MTSVFFSSTVVLAFTTSHVITPRILPYLGTKVCLLFATRAFFSTRVRIFLIFPSHLLVFSFQCSCFYRRQISLLTNAKNNLSRLMTIHVFLFMFLFISRLFPIWKFLASSLKYAVTEWWSPSYQWEFFLVWVCHRK